MSISNRQKKLLRFFGVPVSPEMSSGAAGWEIGRILSREENSRLWARYLYLTRDFGSDSDELQPFDRAELESVEIPEGWTGAEAIAALKQEIVEAALHDGSPYDCPQPEVVFAGRTFVFTGKFSYGSRRHCQDAAVSRGGLAPSKGGVSRDTHYLVVGAEGSKAWKHGSYGTKIEAAIVARREHGTPAIISEEHWTDALNRTEQHL